MPDPSVLSAVRHRKMRSTCVALRGVARTLALSALPTAGERIAQKPERGA